MVVCAQVASYTRRFLKHSSPYAPWWTPLTGKNRMDRNTGGILPSLLEQCVGSFIPLC